MYPFICTNITIIFILYYIIVRRFTKYICIYQIVKILFCIIFNFNYTPLIQHVHIHE